MKRITVSVPENDLATARTVAAERGTTLNALIRSDIVRVSEVHRRKPVRDWAAGVAGGLAVGLSFLLTMVPGPVRAETNDTVALSGLNVCAASFPDRRRTMAALEAAGWVSGEDVSGFDIFLKRDGRVVVAIPTSEVRGCLVAVSGLNLTRAQQMARSFAKDLGGFSAQAATGRKDVEVFVGRLNGEDAGIAPAPSQDFGYATGSAVGLIVLEE